MAVVKIPDMARVTRGDIVDHFASSTRKWAEPADAGVVVCIVHQRGNSFTAADATRIIEVESSFAAQTDSQFATQIAVILTAVFTQILRGDGVGSVWACDVTGHIGIVRVESILALLDALVEL